MSTEELLEKLLEHLSKPAAVPLPVAIDLWDTRNIAAYLKRSVDTAMVRSISADADLICAVAPVDATVRVFSASRAAIWMLRAIFRSGGSRCRHRLIRPHCPVAALRHFSVRPTAMSGG